MKRIRNYGLAVVAALALTAVFGASMASADAFLVPGAGAGETSTLSGSPSAGVELTLGGDYMKCNESSLSGQIVGPEQTDITVSPTLAKCGWYGWQVAWAINGCKLGLHANPGAPGLPKSVDITGCTKPLTFNFSGCQLEIGNQNQVGTVSYGTKEVEGKKVVTAIANLEGLTYTRSGTCISSLQGTFYDGKLKSEWVIKGKTAGGVARDITFEYSKPGVPPAPTVFAVEEAPATISGTRTFGSPLGMLRFGPAGTLVCKTHTMSGTQSSLTASTLTLTPDYSNGCKFNGVEIPDSNIDAGGCKFVFHLTPYFTMDIAGETCESEPITATRPGCVGTIGPQSGLSLVQAASTYSNSGSGKTRSLTISQEAYVETLKVTLAGPNCGKEGVISNGWLQSLRTDRAPTLTATNAGGKQQGLSVE